MKFNEVTLEEVKKYLLIEFDEDDTLLETLILNAKNYIYSLTKLQIDDDIPQELTQALFYLVSMWYENRVPKDKVDDTLVKMITNVHTLGGLF